MEQSLSAEDVIYLLPIAPAPLLNIFQQAAWWRLSAGPN